MPRQKNTRPTSIYWLIDTRIGLADQPFYCGKTIQVPEKRLREHYYAATKRPHGRVGPRILECEKQLQIRVLEIVAASEDWRERERYWIARSRELFPNIMTNMTDGGDGGAGHIKSEETRQKISTAAKKRMNLPEYRAQTSAIFKGKKLSPEHRSKLSAAAKNRPPNPAQFKGKTISAEHRAKLRIANLGKKASTEARANMSAAATGKKKSPEHRASLCLAQQRRKAERCARQVPTSPI